ncbi:hypothetical protein Ccrd_024913 [Cynara cardunculus var. scolymus]|uniref:Mitochondrial inner membrane translocase subunit Tim17/Tim22/Tim23/peroxisomal protein PMP24 n=1 Tax=Cynara cardunculus var. scolymus TaxID=59895 RepID=A0A118JRM8_CYNCS|nr:hypothetical protein Ccrd_024913 [Cynara cardunculus var. scolymus]
MKSLDSKHKKGPKRRFLPLQQRRHLPTLCRTLLNNLMDLITLLNDAVAAGVAVAPSIVGAGAGEAANSRTLLRGGGNSLLFLTGLGETNRKYVDALKHNECYERLSFNRVRSKARGKNLYNGVKTCVLVHGDSKTTKNSAVAGAFTGAALALTFDDFSHEQIVHGAITGAALSTAANLLTGIF